MSLPTCPSCGMQHYTSNVCPFPFNGVVLRHNIVPGYSTGAGLSAFRNTESDSKVEPTSLHRIEHERFQWSEEIKEIESDIAEGKVNPEEYADALMFLLDSAGRSGVSLSDIIIAYEKKFVINKSRTWKKNPDNTYSHVK